MWWSCDPNRLQDLYGNNLKNTTNKFDCAKEVFFFSRRLRRILNPKKAIESCNYKSDNNVWNL